jgi:site-specific recombinase XerD
MSLITETQGIINISIADDYLENWLQSFLIDRKAAGVASGTLHFYRTKLKLFSGYCEAQSVKQISQITSTFLRQYLLYLEETGHNPGGRHAAYRTIRTFLLCIYSQGVRRARTCGEIGTKQPQITRCAATRYGGEPRIMLI